MTEVALADLSRPTHGSRSARTGWERSRREPERLVAFCQPRDPEAIPRHGLELIDPQHQFDKEGVPDA